LIKTALDFLAGRQCTPISGVTAQAAGKASTQPITFPSPTAVQREVPGAF
jgi:hypothetical protein